MGTLKALRTASERSMDAFCLGIVVTVSSYSDTWRALCDVLEPVRASASRTPVYT